MKLFKIQKIVEKSGAYWKSDDLEFHPRFAKAMIKIAKAGYFNEKVLLSCTVTTLLGTVGLLISPLVGWWFAALMLAIIIFLPWGELYLRLPYRTGLNVSNPPSWGFYLYGEHGKIPNSFVICKGMKGKSFRLPWIYEWVRTSRFMEDGTWSHERKGDLLTGPDWWSEERANLLWTRTYDYVYVLNNGERQERRATVTLEEREWRPRCLRWTSLFSRVRTEIDVEFDKAIGEGVGSWKGGTYGCSWDILPGETPIKALRRMEKVRTFK